MIPTPQPQEAAAPPAAPQPGAAAPTEDIGQLLALIQMLQQSQQNGDAGSMAMQGGDGGSLPSIPGGIPQQLDKEDPTLSDTGVPMGNNTGALMNLLHQIGMA